MSACADRRLTNSLLRVGVWFLAVVTLAVGVVATLAPRVFYDHVPWVALAPPYSEHLMRDYGAMILALALVSVVAAITMNRLMVRTALAAYLLFAIPHLVFHVTHHRHYTQGQAIGETAALAIAVLVLAALLALTRRPTSRP
jgi:Ca2+/Na+ antiporter